MSNNLHLALKINVDKKDGETNLNAFNRAFKDAMAEIGKSAEEAESFETLAKAIAAGSKSVEELDQDTRALYETYRKGADLAADRDLLGLRAHEEIQLEIEETRKAYERLRDSGELSQAELAQAALKTEVRIRELQHQTNGWVDALQNAKGSLAALVGSAAGLTMVSGLAIDFESAMADVKKTVDGTDEQFESLTIRIKELTRELPYTAQELASIAAMGGQLGVPIEKLDQFIFLAARMSTAFNISVDQSADAIAKLSNIFNIPIENVEALGDAINVLGNTTAARESDILNVLTRIGGTANQFKLTAVQSAALASTMLEMGAKAEVAGTGLNALLTKLQTANIQGPEFQRALEGMGMSANQLAEDIRANPQQALLSFLKTLQTLDDQTRTETLSRLFGQEYQDDIARLLNGLGKYETALARVGNASETAGAMAREFAARMQTAEADLQLMKNSLNEIGINLGTIFLPAIRDAAVAVGSVANALADFVAANPAIAGVATSIATVAVSAGALRLLFLSMRIVGVKAFGDIRKEADLFKGKLGDIHKEVGKLGAAMRIAGGVASAAWIGWDIGTSLSKEFLIVEKLGIGLAQVMAHLAERAKTAWEIITNPLGYDEALDRLDQKLLEVNATFDAMYEHAEAARNETAKSAAEVATSLETTAEAATNAANKIRDEFSQLNLTTISGVLDFAAQIDRASGNASVLTEELKKWIDQTQAADLSAFAAGLQAAFVDGKLSAEQLAEYNDLILKKSFADLGLDAKSSLGGISEGAREAIGQLDLIANTLTSMGIKGEQRMAALEVAIRAAIGSADSLAAVNELSSRIAALGTTGELSAAQVERLTDQIIDQRNALIQLKPGIQTVEDAMRSLGLTSQAELARAADKAAAVVEQLKEMKAPVADQEAAFMAYANAVVAANENVSEGQRAAAMTQLQIKAAMLGLSDELQKLLGVQVQAGNAGEEAGNKTEKGAKKAAEATREVGSAAKDCERDVQAVSTSMSSWFGSVRDELHSLSEQARAAFDAKLGINSSGPVTELEALKQAVAAAREELGKIAVDNLQVFDPTGMNRFKNAVMEARNESVIAFQEQKIKVLEMVAALESGAGVNESFIRNAKNSMAHMKMLGDEDLGPLRSALDSANQKLLTMTNAAKSALGSLQDDLDRLRGNEEEISRRQHENKKAELNAALEEARALGNREAITHYTEALKVLNDVRAETVKQEKQAAAEAAARKAEATKTTQSTQSQSSSSRTINLQVGNKTHSVGVASEKDEANLIDALTDFSARSR